jgi:hypothetical protein
MQMPSNLLLLALGLQLGSPVPDPAEVFPPILQDVRRQYRGIPVAMAETQSDVECMPHCGAQLRDPDSSFRPDTVRAQVDHSEAVLSALRARGLIDVSCRVQESTFGCGDYPGFFFVALGEISAAPAGGPARVEGAVWVKAAFLVPCLYTGRCPPPDSDDPYFPDAFGVWFLLQPGFDGAWQIIRRVPAFAI